MKIQIFLNKNKTVLIAESIFKNFKILNKINSINHYKIVKKFFPNFDEEFEYNNFLIFPYFNSDIKISGIGKNIKIHGNDIIFNFKNTKKINNKNDEINKKLIYNDFLKLFKNEIPYGIFYIYEIESILYLITTTNKNNIEIINKANKLDDLFSRKILNKNIFNFQPLSEQGIKYIYYDNNITGVVNGIGTIW